MTNLISINFNECTKRISTDKFELGKEYAIILDPKINFDSRLNNFPVFEFVKKKPDPNNGDVVINKKINSDDATMFSNTSYGSSQAICRQTCPIVRQDKFSIVYFMFIPKTIFMQDPFITRLKPMESFEDINNSVANAVYKDYAISDEATTMIITDDICNIFG